jgi:uncharacterized membrane protein YkoI
MNRNIAILASLRPALSLSVFAQQNGKADRLAMQAKISRVDAEKIALAREPGTIKEGEIEKEHDKVIYSCSLA